MDNTVAVPLWVFVGLIILALWAALDRLVLPSLRWYFRWRVNRIIDELNKRLQLRINPFKLTKRQVLIERLMYDAEVLAVAQSHAAEHGMRHVEVMREVRQYAREIVPSFNAFAYFRIAYWLARRLAQSLYRVRLAYADDVGLSEVPPNASVVFVMNHRSNMDYVLVTYLVADRAALSYAVGEWARVWPLQTLIRSLGAYFVRRDASNVLYRKVLARYVHMATAGGVVQAIYPEGGLSLDGSMRSPKVGLLRYMLSGFDANAERDLVFIPVGINYDRVLEDRTQLSKGTIGGEKKGWGFAARTLFGFALGNLARIVTRRWYRMGYAGVGLGTPVSLREVLSARGLHGRTLSEADLSTLVPDLAAVLMKSVERMVPVLPVSLVATAILDQENAARANAESGVYQPSVDSGGIGDGMTAFELKAAVNALVVEFEQCGAHVHIPRQDRDYAVSVGLRMLVLRGAVVEDRDVYHARTQERPLLEYYANSIRHFRRDRNPS